MKRIIAILLLLAGNTILSITYKDLDVNLYDTINVENNEFIFVNQTDETWDVVTSFWTNQTIGSCDWPKNVKIPANYKAVFHSTCCLKYFTVKKPSSFFSTLKERVDLCGRKVFYIRYEDDTKKKVRVNWKP